MMQHHAGMKFVRPLIDLLYLFCRQIGGMHQRTMSADLTVDIELQPDNTLAAGTEVVSTNCASPPTHDCDSCGGEGNTTPIVGTEHEENHAVNIAPGTAQSAYVYLDYIPSSSHVTAETTT